MLSVTYNFVGTTLTINDDNQSNTIAVYNQQFLPFGLQTDYVRIKVNGTNLTMNNIQTQVVHTILITGGTGNETFDLTGVLPADFINLTSVTVNGAAGNDTTIMCPTITGCAATLNGGNGSDTYTLDQSLQQGTVSIADNGASGFDMATIGTTSATGETVGVTSTQVTRSGDGTLTYSGLEQIEVDTSIANDTVIVNSTIGGNTLVTTGNGNDSLTVNSTASGSWLYIDGCAAGDNYTIVGSATLGAVSLPDSGTSGNDNVTITSTRSAAETVTISSTQVTRSSAGTITYSGLESLEVDTGSGNDNVTISSTSAGGTTVNTGSGTDTISATGTAAGTSLYLDGGAGGDTYSVTQSATMGNIFLGDSGSSGFDMATVGTISSTGETVDITSTQVTRTGDGTFNYSGLEQIEVDTSIAADSVTIDSTIGGNTLVTTGNGNDTLTVNSTASGSWIYIDGCADSDTYTIYQSSCLGAISLPESGASGTDTVTVTTSSSTGETIGLSGRKLRGLAPAQLLTAAWKRWL